MEIDDGTLMALADGEIDGEEAARLCARIESDSALAGRYALFTRTSRLIRAAALADPAAAVSPELSARIRDMATTAPPIPENVVPLRRASRRWQPMALAASLALAIGLAAGYVLAPGVSGTGADVVTADLQRRLGTLPSGGEAALPDGRHVRVVASFTDADDTFCREYETALPGETRYVNVACRDGADWSLRFAMATGSTSQGYAPASSLDALDAFYAATGASPPLSVEAERDFLR